jgi:hypothetical protein
MENQTSVPHPKAMTTKDAATYLAACGYPTTHKTLEVWRCRSRGPKYKVVGRRVFYEQTWLDEYMAGVEVKIYDPSKYREGN